MYNWEKTCDRVPRRTPKRISRSKGSRVTHLMKRRRNRNWDLRALMIHSNQKQVRKSKLESSRRDKKLQSKGYNRILWPSWTRERSLSVCNHLMTFSTISLQENWSDKERSARAFTNAKTTSPRRTSPSKFWTGNSLNSGRRIVSSKKYRSSRCWAIQTSFGTRPTFTRQRGISSWRNCVKAMSYPQCWIVTIRFITKKMT